MASWTKLISELDINTEFIRAEFYGSEFMKNDAMIKRFPTKKLSNIVSQLFQGWSPKGGVKRNTGIPAIKTQNLTGNGLNREFNFAEIEYGDVPKRAWAKPDDIYVIRCAHHPRYIGLNIDNFVSIPGEVNPFITEKIIVARGLEKKAVIGYVTTFLRTKYGYTQIQRRLGGLTANYTPYDFGETVIPLPDEKIQDYIGKKILVADKLKKSAISLKKEVDQLFSEGLGEFQSEILSKIEQDGVFKNGGFSVNVEPDLLRNRLDPAGYHPELIEIQKKFHRQKPKFQRLRKLAKLSTNARSRVNSSCSYFISILHVDNKGYLDRQAASEYYPESPGREAKPTDILVSCINPAANRIAVCDDMKGSIACSPEFAILESKELPSHYLAFVLRSDHCCLINTEEKEARRALWWYNVLRKDHTNQGDPSHGPERYHPEAVACTCAEI